MLPSCSHHHMHTNSCRIDVTCLLYLLFLSWFIDLQVCLSVCLSVCLPVCLSVDLGICVYAWLFCLHVGIYMSWSVNTLMLYNHKEQCLDGNDCPHNWRKVKQAERWMQASWWIRLCPTTWCSFGANTFANIHDALNVAPSQGVEWDREKRVRTDSDLQEQPNQEQLSCLYWYSTVTYESN